MKQKQVLKAKNNRNYSHKKNQKKIGLQKLNQNKIAPTSAHDWHHNLGKFLLVISIIFGFGGFGFGFGIRSGKSLPLSINLNQSEQSFFHNKD